MPAPEMSTIGLIEACVEDAIARQKAGRVTRETCIEAMAEAAYAEDELLTWSELNAEMKAGWRDEQSRALDAALASGYVIINR
jgi:hypothetical protein